tara:strand:- start:723 stop:1514 length:792 start_codon:yes stop_codon:yes gene_type:complete
METYKYLKKLGSGGYGSVWKVSKNGKIMALKKIQLGNEQLRKMAIREVDLLQKISNPCQKSLACFYDYHIEDTLDGNILFIEMEYIDGLTLKDFAETIRGLPMLNKYLLSIIQDIIVGIQYLHSHGIIHRDIKPENIMIDDKYQPKLIDIGLGCLAEDCGRRKCCSGFAGTPLFMPQETLLSNLTYFSSDVFSLGASIYYAATGKNIYYPVPKKMNQLKQMALNADIEELNTSSVSLNTLVNRMLEEDSKDRISVSEIIDYFE